MDFVTVLELVLAALVGAVVYGLIVRALPGRQPLEDEVDKLAAAIKDAAARTQEAANKANTASIIAAKAAQTAANATPAPVEPVSPPVATPQPPVVPEPPKAAETPVPAPQPTPAPTGLAEVYIDRDDLMKALGAGYVYAVVLDGQAVHQGFGPADAYWTWPDKSVRRAKPTEVEVPIEG